MFRMSFLVLVLLGSFSFARADWEPSEIVPEISYVGQASQHERVLGQQLRQRLIRELSYWRNNGLPQPAPLEGIYYISSTDHIKVTEFLHTLNPHISDIRAHVEAQHQALLNSNLYTFLKGLQAKFGGKIKDDGKIKDGDLAEMLFDFYAQIRYGYSVKNFYKAVVENDFLGNVDKGLESHAHKDNAFFGEFPRIELTDVLPARKGAAPAPTKDDDLGASLKDLASLINVNALNKEAKGNSKSRKIVILPRSTQGEGDVQVSTLNDPSVIEHEAGHWFIHGLVGDQPIDTMLDEAGADYMFASAENNPKIGEFFAKASGIVAERLKNSNNPEELHFAEAMEKMAEKGLLRDLSEVSNIDSLDRAYKVVEAHDAADPVRTFIWQLRNQAPASQVDPLMIASLKTFSELPAVVSSRSTLVLGFRQIWMQINNYLQVASQVKALAAKPENQGKKPEDLEMQAKKIVAALVDKAEDEARAKRLKNSWLGFTSQRKAIKSDYVLPEFFRAFYRNAQAQAPQLLPLIRKLAEEAMHSSSIVVKSQNGQREIIFLRSKWSKFNAIARLRIYQLVNRLAELRAQIQALPPSDDQEDSSTKTLKAVYEKQLEKIQEYERTGATRKLFIPHPVLSVGAKVVDLLKRKSDQGGKGGSGKSCSPKMTDLGHRS